MKILVLASWFRPGAGGAYVHLSEIYRRLKQGIVVVGDQAPGDEASDAALPWPVRRIPTGVRRSWWKLNTAVSVARGYRAVKEIAASEQPDVIHAGHYLPWGLYAARLGRLRSTPYALFTWGEDLLAAEGDPLKSRAMRQAAAGARWLFTNSDFTTERLRPFAGAAATIHTIYGAADTARFHPGLPGEVVRRRLGLEDRVILLSVGALRPQQGIDQLLGCVARLAERFPRLHYVIAGRGPYEPELRRKADELCISKRVTLAGYVPDAELPLYYAACDVFAMLHRRVEATGEEMCFGLVFLEAGACGKPVVGTRVGGTQFAIRDGETGFRVAPESDAEADQRLAQLLGDAAMRARMGAEARLWIASTFSWDKAAQQMREAHGW